jgi:hypothetical protein
VQAGLQVKLTPEKRLILAFSITFLILTGEVIGGLLSNSLALLSDAGHVLTDAFALGMSMIAARISKAFGLGNLDIRGSACLRDLRLPGSSAYRFSYSWNPTTG